MPPFLQFAATEDGPRPIFNARKAAFDRACCCPALCYNLPSNAADEEHCVNYTPVDYDDLLAWTALWEIEFDIPEGLFDGTAWCTAPAAVPDKLCSEFNGQTVTLTAPGTDVLLWTYLQGDPGGSCQLMRRLWADYVIECVPDETYQCTHHLRFGWQNQSGEFTGPIFEYYQKLIPMIAFEDGARITIPYFPAAVPDDDVCPYNVGLWQQDQVLTVRGV